MVKGLPLVPVFCFGQVFVSDGIKFQFIVQQYAASLSLSLSRHFFRSFSGIRNHSFLCGISPSLFMDAFMMTSSVIPLMIFSWIPIKLDDNNFLQ